MAIKKLLDIILTSLNDGKAIDIDLFDVKKIIATIFLLVISILMLNWGDPREFIYFNF